MPLAEVFPVFASLFVVSSMIRFFSLIAIIACLWLSSVDCAAQVGTETLTPETPTPEAPAKSSVTGAVQSEANDALVGTSIIAVHLITGARHTTVADGLGNFSLPDLPAGGPYAIKVEQSGFRPQLLTDVLLGANKNMHLELTLLLAPSISRVKNRPQ